MSNNECVLEYVVECEDAGETVLGIVARKLMVSSRLIRKVKRKKNIFLNDRAVSVNATVRENDRVKVIVELERNIFDPEDLDIEVVYEDLDILIVNKRPFTVVHPTKGHPYGTLGNGIAYFNLQKGFDYKIRFINRLDRDTSGLVMIAKNPYGQQVISNQMIANEVDKVYYAVVEGIFEEKEGTINLPIGRRDEGDIERVVMEEGQQSVTHYKVVEELDGASLIEINLETGRTHQIRVHMSHIGHSLIGDTLYGKESNLIDRQALHAKSLTFKHVRTKEQCFVDSQLPEDMRTLVEKLRKNP